MSQYLLPEVCQRTFDSLRLGWNKGSHILVKDYWFTGEGLLVDIQHDLVSQMEIRLIKG